MGGDSYLLELVRDQWRDAFLSTEQASSLQIQHIAEDCSQIMHGALNDARSWLHVSKLMEQRVDRCMGSFEHLLSIEFMFSEGSPPSKYPEEEQRRIDRESRRIPILPYTSAQIEQYDMLNPNAEIRDLERYMATPVLRQRLKRVVFDSVFNREFRTSLAHGKRALVFNGVKSEWLPDEMTDAKTLHITKHEAGAGHTESVIRTRATLGIGEEDLKAVTFVMRHRGETCVVRSVDSDLISILLLCCDRLIDDKSSMIDTRVLLDLSAHWMPGTATARTVMRNRKRLEDGTYEGGNEVHVPFMLDVVALWRKIGDWMWTRFHPKNAPPPFQMVRYPIHVYCVLCMLGGNDFVRWRQDRPGFLGFKLRTIWRVFQTNASMQRELALCVSTQIVHNGRTLFYLNEERITRAVLALYHEVFIARILNLPQNKYWKDEMKRLTQERRAAKILYEQAPDKSKVSKPPDQYSRVPPNMPQPSFETIREVAGGPSKFFTFEELRACVRRLHWCYLYWRNAHTGDHPNPVNIDPNTKLSVWGWQPASNSEIYPTTLATRVTLTADPSHAWSSVLNQKEKPCTMQTN